MNRPQAELLLALVKREETKSALIAFGAEVGAHCDEQMRQSLMANDSREAYGHACVERFASRLVENIEQYAQEKKV